VITRFAPSPTGPLHLGHAFAAIVAHDMARTAGGQFLLRIEDIDRQRSKPAWEAQLTDDLLWLGLRWDGVPMRQCDRIGAYDAALRRLWGMGLTYPCTCARRDIEAAARAPQEGGDPVQGPDGIVYPGTCRRKPRPAVMPEDCALRLDMGAAVAGQYLAYVETGLPDTAPHDAAAMAEGIGDVVLARRGMGTSYHLAVTVDDAAQGVTHVTRGADLAPATPIHVLLQRLLGLPTPVYHHHRLIRDDHGRRLAKRDDSRAISLYRAEGATPQDIRRMVGL
jgi:glutamyl-Q tRNA(Asp) synthetase